MTTLTNVKDALGSHDYESYTQTLASFAERANEAAEKWADYGMLRYVMQHQEHAEFVAGKLLPSQPGASAMDVIRMRCALMETLVATERFKGMFFDNAVEGGAYLRNIGVGSPDDVPGDLAERVALAVAKVAEMDDEDVFYLLTHGAHWIVTGAKTRAEIRDLVAAFEHEVTWVPHVRKRQRDHDAEKTQPGAKKAKLLS